MNSITPDSGYAAALKRRHLASKLFELACRFSTWSALLILFVLLASVAARVNHEGSLSVFVDGDPDSESLQTLEDKLLSHPLVSGIERDVDKSGHVSFFLDVDREKIAASDSDVRFEDIKFDLEETVYELDDVEVTIDSSEPIVGWDWGFLTRYPSTLYPEKAGILPGIWGSIWLLLLTGIIAVPLGVGAAIYLEEYASNNWMTRFIKLNLANLAGVPSIVYGILGFAVFVRFFGKRLMLPGGFQLLPMGPVVLAGALTLALLILPIIIVATQEALKAVPQSIRSASVALGATKWQTIRNQVLPAGLPGIATGVILALSRALGETAPIVLIGVLSFTRSTPGGIETPMDLIRNPAAIAKVPVNDFATLPIQIYNWAPSPYPDLAAQGARAIVVLLAVLLAMNSVAILIRHRFQKNMNW